MKTRRMSHDTAVREMRRLISLCDYAILIGALLEVAAEDNYPSIVHSMLDDRPRPPLSGKAGHPISEGPDLTLLDDPQNQESKGFTIE